MATPIEWKERLDAVEGEIRQGRLVSARLQLDKLYKAKVPLRFQVRFSELARRCEAPILGLRLLFPIVRSDARVSLATAEQKAEYAACLTRIGAVEEAIFTLTPLAAEFAPANLYLAFAFINRWEYAEAIGCLQRYLAAPGLTPYAQAVGRFNLAASLTAVERSQESLLLLQEIEEQAQREKLTFLHGACLELRAQNYIAEENWTSATQTLQQALALLGNSETREAFFIRKWQAFVEWLSTPVSTQSREGLERIRVEARERSHWETLRQTDYFEAQRTLDPQLLGQLYYGTRFASFREKILKLAGRSALPDPFHYPRLTEGASIVEVFTARLDGKTKPFLAPAKLPYRLLQILSSDWYRPFRLPTLFGLLYPNEFYHPTSSKLRVHFQIQKLRQAFSRARVPLTLEQTREEYRLRLKDQGVLRLERAFTEAPHHPQWEALRLAFGSRSFQAREAKAILNCSERSVQRFLNEGCRAGLCRALGAGPARTYQILSAETLKIAA